MKQTTRILPALVSLSFLAVGTLAFATGNNGSFSGTSTDQPGTAATMDQPGTGSASTEQSVDSGSQQTATDTTTTSQTSQTSQSKLNDQQKKQAKMAIVPHTAVMEASLQSAIDQLKGMRTQVKASEGNSPSKEFLSYYKVFSREIRDDFKTAMTHQGHFKNSVKKFPEISQNEDYRSVGSALSEAESFHNSWQKKLSNNEYWKNNEQVMNDIDQMEKRLASALDKTKSFNSNQLDVSSAVG